MEEEKKIKLEIEKLHQFIQEHLSTNEVLKGFEVKNFSLINHETRQFGRICFDANGKPYYYDQPGPCP